jgi:hypothetical protein
MLFSIYPTDSRRTREDVIAQASTHAGDPLVFTSFHIPEAEGLLSYGAYLQRLHREHGTTFCGDVSPRTLEALGVGTDGLGLMRQWGVTCLRIDYGFDPEQIRRIARSGDYTIAVNASTADDALLDSLEGLRLVGWHNYYPRPETGLSLPYFLSQCALFAARGLEVYAFLPGETSFRAPLHAGLPTIEEHRHRNAWRNYLALLASSPAVRIVCAEGTIAEDHLRWIQHFENTAEVTLPLTGVDPSVEFLRHRAWRLRVEDSEVSFRLEGTREARQPARLLNADQRARGSLQMDLAGYGRYCGEIHLMRTDRPLTHLQTRVAEIPDAYRGAVDLLTAGITLRFE